MDLFAVVFETRFGLAISSCCLKLRVKWGFRRLHNACVLRACVNVDVVYYMYHACVCGCAETEKHPFSFSSMKCETAQLRHVRRGRLFVLA